MRCCDRIVGYVSFRSVEFGDPNEFDEDDFANRPWPPRACRASRVVLLAAIAAVVAIVAAGLVIGGGDGSDNSPPVTRSTP